MCSRTAQLFVCAISLGALFAFFVVLPHALGGDSPLYTRRALLEATAVTAPVDRYVEACRRADVGSVTSFVVNGVTVECGAHKKDRLNG